MPVAHSVTAPEFQSLPPWSGRTDPSCAPFSCPNPRIFDRDSLNAPASPAGIPPVPSVSILLLLLAIPFAVLACVLLTTGAGLPPIGQALVTGTVMCAYLTGVGLHVVRRVRRLGRRFDRVMEEAGMAFGRREVATCCYEGSVGGKPAAARVTPAYRFQPWRIEVSLAASPGGRIALGSARPLLDCRGAERLRFDGPLADVHVYAGDHEEARRVLTSAGLEDALGPLIHGLRAANSWELYLQPERIRLRVRAYAVNDEAVAGWLKGVRDLALS